MTPRDPAAFEFNPDQPRDGRGQFAPVGSGAADKTDKPAAAPLPDSAVRPLPRAEAAARTGLSPAQLEGFRAVVSIDEFVKNPPPGIKDGILLGKTRNQPHNLYWHLAATHGLQPWTKTYPQSLGPRYRDHVDAPDCTRRFMDGLFAQPALKDKPIVFLCPINILKPGAGKYTRQEMEYLLADPERATRVVLVAGTDDYIDPLAVTATGGTARQRFDRVRATLDARRGTPAAGPTLTPETHPAELDDLTADEVRAARFDFDPDKHPRGDHGQWAAVRAAEAALAPPVIHGLAAGGTRALDATTANWSAGLDEYQSGVVKFYTTSMYESVNAALRASPRDLSAMSEGTRHNIRALDAAIRAYPEHPAPLTSYRGVKRSTPEKVAATKAGLDAAFATGDAVTLDGFTSASLDPFVGLQWGQIALEIKSKRGAYIGEFSERASEKEVLHTHGERFKVTGAADRVYRAKNGLELVRRTYTLEAAPEPPPPLPPPAPGAAFADFDPDRHPKGTDGKFVPAGASAPVPPPGTDSDRMKRLTAGWTWDLSEGERGAVKQYTGPAYAPLNRGLRDCPETLDCLDYTHKVMAANLDAALRKYPRHPVQTSYRGMNVKSDAKWERLRAGFDAAFATGDAVTLNGFTSASLDPVVAVLFASDVGVGRAVLEIRSPRGAYLGTASNAGREEEVLHTHGERFKVVAVGDREYRDIFGRPIRRPTYTLEAVADAPPPVPRPARTTFGDWDESKVHRAHGQFAPAGGAAAVAQSPVPAPAAPMPTVLYARTKLGPDQKFGSACRRWLETLDADTMRAVKGYTAGGYYAINATLRPPSDESHKTDRRDLNPKAVATAADLARRLVTALTAAPVAAAPVTSYRGVRSRFPDKILKLEAAFAAALSTGDAVTLDGLSSASINPYTAADWAPKNSFVLELKSRRGVCIDSHSSAPHEREVLHNHGARFRVVGVRDVEYHPTTSAMGLIPARRRTYTLEEVEPAAPPARFHDGQARDDHGRWAAAGGAGAFDPRHDFGDGAARPHAPVLTTDLPAPLTTAATAWAATLTPAEREVFRAYTYFGYKDINKSLADADGDHTKVPDQGYYADPGRRVRLMAAAAAKHPPPPPPKVGLWGRVKKAVGFGDWNEDQHPRDHGKFAPASGAGGPAAAPAPPVVPTAGPAPGKPDVIEAMTQSRLYGPGPLGDFVKRGRWWVGKLDPKEAKALLAYTGDFYRGINKALRAHPNPDDPAVGERTRKWVRRLRRAMATAPVNPEPVTTYRGIKTTAKKKLPLIEAGFRAALATGEPITLNGFTSSSIDPAFAAKWTPAGRGVVLEIKSRRGVYVANAAHNPQEQEVLHDHGSRFRVKAARKVEYVTGEGSRVLTTYTLEEVEPERPAAPTTAAYKFSPGVPQNESAGWGGAAAARQARPPRERKWMEQSQIGKLTVSVMDRAVPENPQTPDEVAKVTRFRKDCDTMVRFWMDKAYDLSDKQKAHYGDALTDCFRHMPAKNVQRVLENTGGRSPTFYSRIAEITRVCARMAGRQPRPGEMIAGMWSFVEHSANERGELHLDGGHETDPNCPPLTHQIYAHELGHALDGHFTHSSTPEWKAAWTAEIDRPDSPLSDYARVDPQEGFAEFHRLTVTNPTTARAAYPLCHAFFKDKGFA